MVYQSSIRLAEGEQPKVEQVAGREGVFEITNAYEGSYQYFAQPKPAVPEANTPAELPAENK
jgi:hypothetical protein